MADALLELIIKIGLALVIIWMFMRITWVLYWMVQPFMAGFAAGVLVTLLFATRPKR